MRPQPARISGAASGPERMIRLSAVSMPVESSAEPDQFIGTTNGHNAATATEGSASQGILPQRGTAVQRLRIPPRYAWADLAAKRRRTRKINPAFSCASCAFLRPMDCRFSPLNSGLSVVKKPAVSPDLALKDFRFPMPDFKISEIVANLREPDRSQHK